MNKLRIEVFLSLFGLTLCASCQTSSHRMQKARILDATMDPAKTSPASMALSATPGSLWEKSQTSGSGSVGSACPTCGS